MGTGNDINNARIKIGGSATGGFTTSIIMGGEVPPPAAQSVDTETYNGTNWTEVNNLNTKKNFIGWRRKSNSWFSHGWRTK